MSGERGLVISPPIEASPDGGVFVKNSHLDAQEVRFCLLFWDKFDFPDQNYFGFGLNADSEYLVSCGLLGRTKVQVSGGNGASILKAAHVEAFRQLDQKEPGQWSIATGERSLSFPNSDLDVGRGALVQLHHAVPVPDKDVPLQDILEFRSRRRSELLALRHHLEAIYQRIIAAGDGALALNSEVEALQSAISDHIKASKETKLKFRAVSLNASLNLVRGVVVGAGAFGAGLPAIASALTGMAAAINVGPGTALTWGKPTGTPFSYVSAYHEEVF